MLHVHSDGLTIKIGDFHCIALSDKSYADCIDIWNKNFDLFFTFYPLAEWDKPGWGKYMENERNWFWVDAVWFTVKFSIRK